MVGKVRDRAVRVSVLLGICLALVAGGALVWGELRAVASNRADGDPGQGSYLQDPERADRTAGDVLDGIVAEGEDPPADATAFAGTESGSGASGAPDPVRWADGGWRPSSPLRARTAPSEPAIGALFSPGNDWDADHHCSASVVHSPEGDLIATAAHCVYQDGFRTNLAFVPGYRDGKAPFGVWVPTRIDVDPRWTGDEDPDHDVAFLRLRRPGHPGERLEDVTGALTIRFRPRLPLPARLVGYPNDREQPLECYNTARAEGPTQLRLDCADVPNGTSGGPVLTDGHTLIGVIGGRDGGGDETTSYSSWFDDSVHGLYTRATGGR
ncbi:MULTISPECIES: trypsin-like serine peptidase [unclassified Streptomyces]|uniref:trypsin-like serine peptidase n=1 Tax=unclassified Streptomyces TaxID=2593676 RepID=UPI002E30139E|nr:MULTISPECIES: trypsin-like peptidase domain-containing protein [unclassified Streptomyces]WUC64041.1 serine protease [Streptomyces sp. NBC_00539]